MNNEGVGGVGENLELNNLSWQERILLIMKNGKWYTHKQIVDALGLGRMQDEFTTIEISRAKNIYYYLKCLIKTGYVIRAHLPKEIEIIGAKYVYKIKDPNKKFKIVNLHNFNVGRARRLKNDILRINNIKNNVDAPQA